MNEIITILTEALKRNDANGFTMSVFRLKGREDSYTYIKASMRLEANEQLAIRSVCDNQGLLLMKCDEEEAVVIIKP